MCREVVGTVVSVLVLGADCQEVADWRVMGNLFTVYVGAIRVGSL